MSKKERKKRILRLFRPFVLLWQFIIGFFSSLLYLLNQTGKLLKYILSLVAERIRFSIRLRLMLGYAGHAFWISIFLSVGVLSVFSYVVPASDSSIYMPLLAEMFLIGSVVVILWSFWLGNRAGKRLVEPIAKMNETVREISINNLSERIEVSGVKDELKDLAITFNEMMDKIQTSVEKQNQFVSDASHELRTPISVVKGYVDLLDRWGKEEVQVRDEAILAIKQESDHMKQLIEKLLFLARGDRQAQKIEKQTFAISELMEEIYRETKMIDQDHEIILAENEEGLHVYADRGMLKEAVRIFVENSLKYTPAGGRIFLSCFRRGDMVEVSIQDTGIGIRKEEIRKIFDRFYRSDESRSKKSGGTGLGLAIAKWIIDSHDGKIYVKSEVDKGSEFLILFPIAVKENGTF